MNKAEFYDSIKEDFQRPNGGIQWKGTDVCIDLLCVCGANDHFDGEFFYFFKCRKCGRKYSVGARIVLKELTTEQAEYVETESHGFRIGDEDESDL